MTHDEASQDHAARQERPVQEALMLLTAAAGLAGFLAVILMA